MKTKILLWSVVSVLTAGIASAVEPNWDAAVAFPAVGEPQVIHLTNGMKLTLLGTSYGYHHMAPGYEKLGTANWIYTAPNSTMVWIETEHPTNQWPSYELLVSDRANTDCVNIEESHPSTYVKAGVDIQGFRLNAFPRWDKETILRVRPFGGDVSKEQFVISNRVTAALTNWIPKPLPDKQSDGDLEVTLTKFIAGASKPYYKDRNSAPPNELANQCVRLDFDIQQNGRSATNWNPWPVQTSDAAGNQVRGLIYAYPTNGIYPYPPGGGHDGFFYQPGLWPDEPAWKVRLEFSRTSGFSTDEVWCVTNIPVQPGSQQDVDNDWVAEMSSTNFIFAETTIGGIHLKLFRGLQFLANSDSQKHITVLVKADPYPQTKGIKLTVLKATDEQNHDLDFFWGGTTINYGFEPTWVHDAKSLNLTIAVQKLRFVEFTVKPTKQ